MGESVKATVVTKRHNEESNMNIGICFTDFKAMYEVVEAAVVPDQYNEESIGDLQYN